MDKEARKECLRLITCERRAEEKAESKELWSGIKFHYKGQEYITKFKSSRRRGNEIIVTMDTEKVI